MERSGRSSSGSGTACGIMVVDGDKDGSRVAEACFAFIPGVGSAGLGPGKLWKDYLLLFDRSTTRKGYGLKDRLTSSSIPVPVSQRNY